MSQPHAAAEAVAAFLRQRREALARHASQIGVDYVLVRRDNGDPTLIFLEVHFIPATAPADNSKHDAPFDNLAAANVLFFKDEVPADNLFDLVEPPLAPHLAEVLTLSFRYIGDSDDTRRLSGGPIFAVALAGVAEMDPFFDRASFSLDLEPPLDIDCAAACTPPPPAPPKAAIDYLARDYASFRHVLLERLGHRLPQWTERSPADQLVAITEVLADAADQLAYFQDAVATEAYLGTARQRISVRRHARLIGYRMNEGVNARAWVRFETTTDGIGIQSGSGSIESQGNMVAGSGTRFTTELWHGDAIRAAGQTRLVVEIVSDTQLELDEPFAPDLTPGTNFLRPGAQLLPPVPGLSAPVLPTGSTELERFLAQGPTIFETIHPIELYSRQGSMPIHTWGSPEFALPAGATSAVLEGQALNLGAGDLVIFEEVKGRDTGLAEDTDPQRRHIVRLTRVEEISDPLGAAQLTAIEWAAADALPFILAVNKVLDDATAISGIAVARGNVVLADHGRTVGGAGEPLIANSGRFRPRLFHPGLTHRVPYDHRTAQTQPAAETLDQDPQAALPVIDLRDSAQVWRRRCDLLASDRFAADFVVEVENDGHAVLRFGDGKLGRRPAPGTVLTPRYRVGHGVTAHLGAGSLVHLLSDEPALLAAITVVRNPLAARGGHEPESLAEVRRAAPGSLLDLEVGNEEAQIAKLASLHPEVSRATARLRWTGSWQRLEVAVERRGAATNAAFLADVQAFLEDYRQSGWELVVQPLAYVGLDILLTVRVAPDAVAGAVERRLLEVFSNRVLADGSRGFFHADNLAFGQSIYLSRLIERAMAVKGVLALDTEECPPRLNRFRRFGEPSRGELASGQIRLRGTEIARVDNDPAAPERGRIRFTMEGGR